MGFVPLDVNIKKIIYIEFVNLRVLLIHGGIIMNRLLASVFAPIVFYILSIPYGVINYLLFGISKPNPFPGIIILYIYSFPFFFIAGIPISIIIDKMNIGWRWVNYSVAGGMVLLILVLKKYFEHGDFYLDTDSMFAYLQAGLAFFISLRLCELMFQKLYKKYEGGQLDT